MHSNIKLTSQIKFAREDAGHSVFLVAKFGNHRKGKCVAV